MVKGKSIFIVLIILVLLIFIFRIIIINNNLSKIKNVNNINNIISSILLVPELPRNPGTIPKILLQTYHKPDRIPNYIKENILKYASDYEYHLFDDNSGLDFLKKYYTQQVIDRYNNLSGAHKADLLRYCLMYIYGGVYADIKTLFIKPLNQIFDHSLNVNKELFYSVKSKEPDTLYQGILASTKNNPLFIALIYGALHTTNFELMLDYLLFTRQIYYLVDKIKNLQDVVLFKETCISNPTDRSLDKYGLYCKIIDERNNEHIIDVRDPTYPWR